MKFKDASKIHEAIERMRLANYPVARNRAKVNSLMDGNPSWSLEEQQKNRIFTNVNPLYGTRIVHSARQSMDNAILKPGNFFQVSLEAGERSRRIEHSAVITEEANKVLRRCQAYKDLWSATNAQVVLHAIGPMWWKGRENIVPLEVGIEDVLVPAQTLLNFSNLEFFAIYRQWTYAELFDMTHGPQRKKGWNMELVKRLLEDLGQQSLQSTVMGTRWLMPEKLEQDLKENAGLFMTSAAPTLFVWDFYFRRYDDDEEDQAWDRRVVLDYMQMETSAASTALQDDSKNSFLYEEDDYAKSLEEIVHFQVGNCSSVAPFRYYSARSLGFLLFAVCQLQNRAYCRFSDATFANMLELFRNVGEDDRERLEKVDLWHMGIVPDGLSFVTAEERHVVNEKQVEMFMAMNKQLMGESSSTWMPEIDTGTDKEQTLGEARIRLQTSASLSNALLNQQYDRAVFLYNEQCRRLCLAGTRNKWAKKFQEACMSRGVPRQMLDVEKWNVTANRVLGGGNIAMEGLQAEKLMAVRGAYDGPAQRKILYTWTLANSNADMANELVPLGDQEVAPGTTAATLAFGTLMEGLPVSQPRSLDEVSYVKTLVALDAQVLQQIEALDQVPQSTAAKMHKITGLASALGHTQEHLAALAQDTTQKELVKGLNEQVQQMVQELDVAGKKLSQELQESAPSLSPEMAKTAAKIQAMNMEAQAKMERDAAKDQQKHQHKDAQWVAENARRNADTQAEIERDRLTTAADVQNQMLKTHAEVAALDLKTAGEIARPKPEGEGAAKKK